MFTHSGKTYREFLQFTSAQWSILISLSSLFWFFDPQLWCFGGSHCSHQLKTGFFLTLSTLSLTVYIEVLFSVFIVRMYYLWACSIYSNSNDNKTWWIKLNWTELNWETWLPTLGLRLKELHCTNEWQTNKLFLELFWSWGWPNAQATLCQLIKADL